MRSATEVLDEIEAQIAAMPCTGLTRDTHETTCLTCRLGVLVAIARAVLAERAALQRVSVAALAEIQLRAEEADASPAFRARRTAQAELRAASVAIDAALAALGQP